MIQSVNLNVVMSIIYVDIVTLFDIENIQSLLITDWFINLHGNFSEYHSLDAEVVHLQRTTYN